MSGYSPKDQTLRTTLSVTSSRRPRLTKSYSNHGSMSSVGSTGSGNGAKSGGVASIQSAKINSSPCSTLTASRKGLLRVRSLGHVLASSSSLYLAQERAYLKRIRNQRTDDYYTKGISGAALDARDLDLDVDSDDDLLSFGNLDLLTDFADDRNEVDYSLAFDLMKNSGVKLSIDKSNQTVDKSTVEDPHVLERLEWQAMLLSVLTGDVVRSEKTKIIDLPNLSQCQESFAQVHYKENLWFGIRAKLFNRLEDDQKKLTLYRRNLVDDLIEQIMNYSILYDADAPTPRDQITKVLDDYEKACDLWSTLEEMKHDKPACRSEAFQDRIDTLTAWLSITDAIERETKSFASWIGNDDLDPTRGATVPTPMTEEEELTDKSEVKKIFEEDTKLLAERIVKEKDVHIIVRKRIFYPLAPWMVKSKNIYIRLCRIFEQLKLPDYMHRLIELCLVPVRLIKEVISLRMKYAVKLQNPTLMMIDQMLDDFKSYITIALEINSGIMEYCQLDSGQTWYIKDLFEKEIEEFDRVVLYCVHYYLLLLNKKLIDSSLLPYTFRTNKEPEELEDAYKFLMNLGNYIDGGGIVVAENITTITSCICQKLLGYLFNQMNNPPTPVNGPADLIRWYSSTTNNFGQLRRKLARFTEEILRDFTNSVVFEVSSKSGGRTKNILDILRESNHILVYTGTVEAQGIYFFASPELLDKDTEILKIINGRYILTGPNRGFSEFSTLLQSIRDDAYFEEVVVSPTEERVTDNSYVLAVCPPRAILWDGPIVNLHVDEAPVTDLKDGQLLMISKLSYKDLHVIRDRFVDFVSDVDYGCLVDPVEQRSSLTKVHQDFGKINKVFFKMTLAVLDLSSVLIEKCRNLIGDGSYQELVNNYFIYARDFGKLSVKWLDASRKLTVIMRLMQLSVEWVSFICDDCTPTDRKTFRWCVLALEFGMEMTRGFNVLVLSEELFHKLKLKVARCMSLLISHFDIMGARSSEAEKRRLLKWSSQHLGIENTVDDEQVLVSYRKEVMGQIEEIERYRIDVQEQLNSIGRVLDVLDLEYHYVTLLASLFLSLSIRWQKGKFIGGGSFGQVYAAVNLDTGGVMAVKEIVFHDSQSLKLIPSIKEEMTVLEMLNHPNVVQYFGVEVHRDKVYIFMEFCEGGSLLGLIAHGRIEDEMVIQVYTLQMLEGLAYLHQSDVVHRDIKPENILLDHNGVIKFVDFGAAKVIAASGKTRNVTAASSPKGGHNPQNSNSMTGTPMYMSPEVITGQFSPKNGLTDIWSLGCCVLEMATGRRPWANLDNEWAIMYHIAAGHKPQLPPADQLSEAGRKFISRCLEHDPRKRPGAVELLSDPWIVQIRQAAFGSGESGTTSSSEASASF